MSNEPSPAGGWPAVASTMRHVYQNMHALSGIQTMLKANQKKGFDCPGCAWPEGKERSVTEFCENGAKIIADTSTSKKADAEFFRRYSVAELRMRSEQWLNSQGRLVEPMVLWPGASHYTAISWQQAFSLISQELHSLDSADKAIFYTSGRTSNEAAFLYQLFVRMFGTNNLPDCSNMCHESSGAGLNATIGIGKGTVSLEDFDHADAILVIGQNPGTNHPRMLTSLQKAAQRGCQIMSINPLKEAALNTFIHPQHAHKYASAGTKIASFFLQIPIGSDIALLKGIMKAIVEENEREIGAIDEDFIRKNCEGYDEFLQELQAVSWESIVESCTISQIKIQEVGRLIARSQRIIACWAMGITQHKNGVANVQEIVNLLLLRGQFGKQGAGACPVRGHSNVQGDRTMGIYEKPSQIFLQSLEKEFNFKPPQKHGFDTVEAIEAMHKGHAEVFFALGGNFLSASPDTDYTAAALKKCKLVVQVSTKLNRSHLETGATALILPCLSRIEKDLQKDGLQFVSVENTMGMVHSSRGHLKPASEHLMSEVAIVANIAASTLADSQVDWLSMAENYDGIRDCIARVIPGFRDYNKKIRQADGFELPNAPRFGAFDTPTKKAQFTVNDMPESMPKSGEFLLMTIRSHDQFNTTIYSGDDRYRGISNNRQVVLMNAQDMEECQLAADQVVDLVSCYDGQERRARNFNVIPYDIPRGCVASYFPETNVLVPLSHKAEKSNTPASKSVLIRIYEALH